MKLDLLDPHESVMKTIELLGKEVIPDLQADEPRSETLPTTELSAS